MTGTKIVIVGAGAAGLTAAKELRRLEQNFILLEASHRIGGRAYTEVLAPNMPFDLGAHWIMEPSKNPLMRLAERYRLRLEKDGKHYTAGRYFEDGGWLPKGSERDLGAYWDKQFEAMAQAIKGHQDISVYDAIDNDNRWAGYFHALYAKDNTRDVDQASAEDALAFVREEDDLAVASGLGTLMIRYSQGVPVMLNTAVRSVDYSGSRLKLNTAKGRIHADKVILTVSNGVLASQGIEFKPALPNWKLDAIQGLPLGSHTRVALMFDKAVLHELPAYFTINTSKEGPIHFRNQPFGNDYVEIVMGGRVAEWLEKSGQRATVEFVLAKLRDVLGSKAVPYPTHHIVSAWNGDEWAKGAYSCAQPGAADQRSILAQAIDNRIYFAGEATSSTAYASIHGACISGRDAARAAAT
ncbi:MAG TPA: FAD-dependent oxidoreductase [Gammaproteobacteria bacterium]|nr:FAD-dependent oxidoreductase [Gammaproteobacteria bacterium]HIK68387.1 FAD-dependent oxidoreductase [Pseudomonadales bacterium]